MRFVIWAGGMPFNGETVKTKSLGGSESAAYYLARSLAARRHQVVVFTSLDASDVVIDGVTYSWHGPQSETSPMGAKFDQYAVNTPHDVLIAQRVPFAFMKRYASKINVWQLHDLALHRSTSTMLGQMCNVDLVTTVSEWHAEQVGKVWNIPRSSIEVVHNGVDAALYTAANEEEAPVIPDDQTYTILYQSRPERGLVHLLRPGGIMDRIRHLPVRLVRCTYDAGTVPQLADLYARLNAWADALPNVTTLPAQSKGALAKLQMQCDALVYPTEFEEVSCITAMESMHAALPLLTTNAGALPETCKSAGAVIIPLKDGSVDEDAFVARLEEWFAPDREAYHPELAILRAAQREAAENYGWGAACTELLSAVDRAFETARASHAAVLRTAIETSDIVFAQWYVENKMGGKADNIIERRAISELEEMYRFARTPEDVAAHYAAHQGAYYDGPGAKAIGEDVTGTTRFRGVLSLVNQALTRIADRGQAQGIRILDYGCAHGHYLVPLAKLFPMVEFVGIDISARAVEAARVWIEREELANVTVVQGTHEDVADFVDHFDIILACEVLEHVWNYGELLATLRNALTVKGALILTTPTGRWESSGTEAFRKAREHLHHFDRADIEEITSGHETVILHAPAGADASNFALGSYVWAVWPDPVKTFWAVNYERKLRMYAPRQTVSLCMIVKDAQDTIGRAVHSVIDWVDEVRIFIDPSTVDATRERVIEIADEYPHKPISIFKAEKSAVIDGFDEARNESIANAAGDWILWMDADEELHNPANMHKLLRPSMHHGFGFPQVHYSLEPDQVLTTDYPCRLFRNHRGVKFYGVVHEHPESELGKAVTLSLVRQDIKFLHGGYVDEATRKRRYERNYPLLLRDLEKFPKDRPLNRYLHLRDIAQGIVFDSQRRGGVVLQEHVVAAREGIRIMESMIDDKAQPRMITDAMQYYSHCVVTSGGGFDAEFTIGVGKQEAPSLARSYTVKGRFHSSEFYSRVVNFFVQESVRNYEDRYV